MTKRIIAFALAQNFAVGWVLHFLYLPSAGELQLGAGPVDVHGGHGSAPTEAQSLSPLLHYLRDTALAAPAAVAVALATTLLVRRLLARTDAVSLRARLGFATATALAFGLAAVPEVLAHGLLFDEQYAGGSHVLGVALVTLRYTFALAVGWVLLFGVPWQTRLVTSQQLAAEPAA